VNNSLRLLYSSSYGSIGMQDASNPSMKIPPCFVFKVGTDATACTSEEKNGDHLQ
jgi:hypothetical protein